MIPDKIPRSTICELRAIISHVGRDICAARAPSIIILKSDSRRESIPSDPVDTSCATASRISFPGSSQSEAQKFTMYLRIISILIERLEAKVRITLRDIYYLDVQLFQSPVVVSRLVDDVGYTLGVTRKQLGVISSRKGLIAGDVVIYFKAGNVVRVADSPHGVLIPVLDDIDYLELKRIEFIMILEKEAVYQTLCSVNFYNRNQNRGNGLIITGKGYPDLLTREFIYYLSIHFSYIPIFAALDADPFGLHILSVYRYGSVCRSSLENSVMATPSIRWVGTFLQDVMELDNFGSCGSVLLPLTRRDRKVAIMLLTDVRLAIPDKMTTAAFRHQLQRMLFLGKKAEMNVATCAKANTYQEQIGISSYIESKIIASLTPGK